MTTIGNILTSIPRETIVCLTKAHILPTHLLFWYDLYLFFHSLPDTLSRMQKYARIAHQSTTLRHTISEDTARYLISKLDKPI